MKLAGLHVHNLRNICQQRFSFHSHLNFIVGSNGSGKTSCLEALYLLSTGRSFRSREISHLISHGSEALTVFAKTETNQQISVKKSTNHPTHAQINRQTCLATSELATFLPCQLIYQDVFQIIDAGPSQRRALLDWGLFHVEPDNQVILKNYKRALQQRNMLLRKNVDYSQVKPWDHLLSTISQQLHEKRLDYFDRLYPRFLKILSTISELTCDVHYFKGWDRKNEGKNLEFILEASYSSDKQRLFTQHGAHQADLIIETEKTKAKHFFSRGQQKICLFALKFAQMSLIEKPCMVLIDDMMSELDELHIGRLLSFIQSMDWQFFITCQLNDLPQISASKVIQL